ncbi:MAG: YihY/virulence factor BrkB family protein [Nitratireductor sp.]|nr:YihY/virulence factor BrkB family protein [Nitratireductor sp.]MCB1456610.1 YihY/virulence factor BrkB family protein [Nitratireductor sp.]MCB1459057.1 YihY/virulence factor BrkB family protein [Nitratireductor sp.]
MLPDSEANQYPPGSPALRHAIALRNALLQFGRDDGWAIASHITLSGIMALFPFVIFCTSLAAYFDLGDFPDTAVHLIFDIWPDSVAGAISSEIRTVLTRPRGDILTLGALVSLFFASSGVEALRLGLNRAYAAKEQRNFLVLRAQSILFVLLSAIIVATIAILLVLLPIGWAIARKLIPWLDSYESMVGFWRVAASIIVLVLALPACHKWLPAGSRPLSGILPGALLTLIVWFIASLGFAAWLEQFANYVGTYAGLAGIVIALVFIYIMSVIFLIGAEYNAALARMRNA